MNPEKRRHVDGSMMGLTGMTELPNKMVETIGYRHGGQQPNNVVNRNRNSSHFGRRLKRETLREVRAQLVQRLAGAPSSRPADGGDDAIQPATQSDPERTTAQHSQQTLDVPVTTGPTWSREEIGHQIYNIPLLPVSLTWEVITYTADTKEQRPARGPRQPPGGTTAVPEYPVSAPSRRDEPMRRPPTSDEDTDGEQQSGPLSLNSLPQHHLGGTSH
ncbi:hypothetical protein DPEC_G00377900 [Dallia pectoralis]|nr:hypothetical protein DPEC_G00377900 [Dallia pectoralis]